MFDFLRPFVIKIKMKNTDFAINLKSSNCPVISFVNGRLFNLIKRLFSDAVLLFSPLVPCFLFKESCILFFLLFQIQEKKESQCIFTSGTPSHSHQSLLIECPKGSSNLLIYEAMEASEFPSEDQILAQIELSFMDVSTPVNLQVESHLKNDGSMMVKLVEPLSKLNKSFIIEAGQS